MADVATTTAAPPVQPANDREAPAPHVYRARVPRAIGWSTLMSIVTKALSLVTTVVLARMIPPSEFGVYAAILVVQSGLSVVTGVGLQSAIVQMQGDPRPYLETARTINLLRAIGLYILIFLLAPVLCDFLHVPDAVPLLRVLAISPVITALNAGGTVLLKRELKFNRVFLLEMTEVITYSVSVLLLGIILQTAWALVLGLLAGFISRAVATYFISPVRVGFGFDRAKYNEMYRYAKWIRVQSVVTFLLTTADNLVVARVVGTTSVGLYRMAFQVATQGSSTLIVILANVAFPAFSRLRSDPEHLRETYRGTLGLVASLMVPITVIFVILADLFVQVVLGPKWGLATQCVRIIGLAALIRSFLSTSSPFLQALGYTRADFLLRTWQAVPMLALLYPLGLYYGITGVANAVLVGALVTVPVWVYVLTRRRYLTLRDLLEPIAVPFLGGAVASFVLLCLPTPEPTALNFLLYCAVLGVVYCAILGLAWRLTPHLGLGTVIRAVRISQKPRPA